MPYTPAQVDIIPNAQVFCAKTHQATLETCLNPTGGKVPYSSPSYTYDAFVAKSSQQEGSRGKTLPPSPGELSAWETRQLPYLFIYTSSASHPQGSDSVRTGVCLSWLSKKWEDLPFLIATLVSTTPAPSLPFFSKATEGRHPRQMSVCLEMRAKQAGTEKKGHLSTKGTCRQDILSGNTR